MNLSRSSWFLGLGSCLVLAAIAPRDTLAQVAPEAEGSGASQDAARDNSSEDVIRELVPTLRHSAGRADFEGGPFPSKLDRDGLQVTIPAGRGLRGEVAEAPSATARFRLREVKAGGRAIGHGAAVRASGEKLDPGARPAMTPDGSAAGYLVGEGVEELYEPRLGGVEQLFRITTPLPEGSALEIIVDVETDLVGAREEGRGIIFRDSATGEERLLYSEPAIVDARGRSVAGQLRLSGISISLLFSPQQLADLTYPIVVDPLIGTSFTVYSSSSYNQHRASVAYNSIANEYLVVWENRLSTFAIYGRRVGPTGTLLGSAFTIQSGGSGNSLPTVAYSPATNRYVVAYLRSGVRITTVTAAGSIYGTWSISGNGNQSPRIIYEKNDSFLIVWGASSSSPRVVLAERRKSDGSLVTFNGSQTNDDTVLYSYSGSSITLNPLPAYDVANERFCVTYDHADGSVRGLLLHPTLTAIATSPVTLTAAGKGAAVAWNASTQEFHTYWRNSTILGGTQDLFLQRVSASGSSPNAKRGGARWIAGEAAYPINSAAVAYSAASEETALIHEVDIAANDHDFYMGTLRSDGVSKSAPAFVGTSDDNNTDLVWRVAVAANPSDGRFLAVYDAIGSGGLDRIDGRFMTDSSPRVLTSDPPAGATSVPTDMSVKVLFSDTMTASTIHSGSVRIIDTTTSVSIAASVTYIGAERAAIVNPSSNLVAHRVYQILVSTSCADAPAQNALEAAYAVTFTAGAGVGLADTDGDGLGDLVELALGTDPLRTDTDGDGRSDGYEFGAGTDPLDPSAGGIAGYDVTPPTVVSFSPANGSEIPSLTQPLWIQFSEPIQPTSVAFKVLDMVTNTSIGWTWTLQNEDRTIRIQTNSSLLTSRPYRFVVFATSWNRDLAGNPVATEVTADFTTPASITVPAVPEFEALHHPSMSESTGAGQMARAFAGGMVSDITLGHPKYPRPNVMIAKICKTCETCNNNFGDWWCTGLKETAGGEGTHVSLVNGVLVHGRLDWEYKDRSRNWVRFARTYRSNLAGQNTPYKFAGMFGAGWISNWEVGLEKYSGEGNGFYVRLPDGRRLWATWVGGTQKWSLPSGVYCKFLFEEGGDLLTLVLRNGLSLTFLAEKGRLLWIRDRNGQKQACGYTAGKLTSITDATDRETTISYGANGLVAWIKIFGSAKVEFAYDGSLNLVSVTYPPTDEFETGRQESYTYIGDHLLETITNGREEQTLKNHYDADGTVVAQDHINGSLFYLYDFDYPTGIRTTMIDRMGVSTEVLHGADGTPTSVTVKSNGLNPLDTTTQWMMNYRYNANGQITMTAMPLGNVVKYAYNATGHMIEERQQTSDATPDDEVDLVERWKIDPLFGQVLRYEDARATDPSISEAQRVALSRFYFYDHEDIAARLVSETAEMGATVDIIGTAEYTFGRTGSGQFPPTSTAFNDVNGDGLPDRGGNLWIEVGPSPRAINPASPSTALTSLPRQPIESFYSYSEAGQILIERDPLGRRSRTQYYSGSFGGGQMAAGYVFRRIQDSYYAGADLDLTTGNPPTNTAEPAGRLSLVTEYEHDKFGNTTSIRSPRGAFRTDDVFRTRMTFDANNLLRSRIVSAPFSYETTYSYDGNMKLVEERTQNIVPVDSNGNGIQDGSGEQTAGTPALFRTTYDYCVCNDVVSQTVDADGLALTTTTDHDLNQNRISSRDAFGNVSTELYDERRQVIKSTSGANDSAAASSVRYRYDANGNQTHVHDDDLDVDPGDTPTVTTYDLFDRQTMVTDELGNESETVYDRGGFARRQIFRGPATPGGASVILSQSFTEYDEAGRAFQSDRDHFDAITPTALAGGTLVPPVDNSGPAIGGLSSTLTVYDAGGRATHRINAGGGISTTTCDAADRVVGSTDPRGNSVTMKHDKDGHTIGVSETEVVDVGISTTYVSRTFFDELGRAIVSVSPLGNASRRLFDSRGHAVETADAQANSAGNASALDTYSEHTFGGFWPDVAISGRGNRVKSTFDGVGRLTKTERLLTSDGSGNGTLVKTITTQQAYDRASRLVSQTDDSGNATEYGYDAQSRRIFVKNADGTLKHFWYRKSGDLQKTRDERQVVATFTYDKLGRRTATAIDQLPLGPGQTTYESFQYDGASRMVRGENNHAVTALRYSSAGHVIEEDQTVNVGADRSVEADPWPSVVRKVVASSYDGEGNRTQLSYPGGTVINETYDANDRTKLVKDGATTIAEYMYAGGGARVLEKRLPQATMTLFRSHDMDRRVIRHDQRRTSDGMRIAGYTYAWDRVGNRWFERTLTNNTNASEAGGAGEAFAYDSIYRMSEYQQDVSSSQLDALTTNTPRWAATPTGVTRRAYVLDGVGNRQEVQRNGVIETSYLLNGDDKKTNQYTFVDGAYQGYDRASNLLADGTWRYAYSAQNQLIQAVNVSAGTDVRYRFDVMGRRVCKRVASGAFPGLSYGYCVYIQSGARILEEYSDAGALRKEWVYGIGIDEPLRQRAPDSADLDIDGDTSEFATLWYMTNSIGSVKALVGSSGYARERYVQDVWGVTRDVIGKWGTSTGQVWTLVGNPWGFTGRQGEWEERSGLNQFRARAYVTGLGAFAQRDPLGAWYEIIAGGHARSYGGSNPVNNIDPMGLFSIGTHRNMIRDIAIHTLKVNGATSQSMAHIGSEYIDKEHYYPNYLHGMSDFGQSKAAAREDAALFVESTRYKAIQAAERWRKSSRSWYHKGNCRDAVAMIALSAHTLQDEDAHEGMGQLRHYLSPCYGFGLLDFAWLFPRSTTAAYNETAAHFMRFETSLRRLGWTESDLDCCIRTAFATFSEIGAAGHGFSAFSQTSLEPVSPRRPKLPLND